MSAPRPRLSLRTFLLLVGIAGLLFVASVGVEIVRVVRPAADQLSGRTRDHLSDHDAIERSLRELRELRREVARLVPPFVGPADAPPPREMPVLRTRLRELVDAGAPRRASIERADLPLAMRLLLVQAVEEEADVAVSLLEALRAVELGRPRDAVEALRASGLRTDSTAVLLSAAQQAALVDLLSGEEELLDRLDAIQRWTLWWTLAGAALFLLGAWVLRQRLYLPVRRMERGVARIAAGDLAAEIPVARPDELGRLAAHFNAMTAMLRERAQDEVRRRENLTERFGRLLDESANEICVFDADTLRALQANRGARVNLGYARDEVGSITLPALLADIARPTLDAELRRLRSGEQPRLFLSTRQWRKDGTSYPVEMSVQYSTDGDTAVFVTVTEDAGARQRARDLEQRLRDFALAEARALNDGDLGRALRTITPMAAELLRASRVSVFRVEGDRLRGLADYDARRGEHHEGDLVAPEESSTDPGRLEVPVRTAGRHVATLVVEAGAAGRPWLAEERLAADAVGELIARACDAAERRGLELALARATRLDSIGQLAGGVAHDFNNILTAILGNLEACRAGLGPGDPMDAALAEAEQAARRAADLTRQLLTFARHQVVESRVLDVNLLTQDADRMLRRLIGPSIELRQELDAGLRAVRMGPGQLEQVLVNLVVNARDAMPDGGTITIATRARTIRAADAASHPSLAPGEYAELSVRDTGGGMSGETLERIFEPFFTTKSLGEGTGLGLAVSYGIVRQAGGDISVASEPGRGTTFRILLPTVDEAPEPPSGPSRRASTAGHETVLVVEDERPIRELIARSLGRRGYVVLQAEDGAEALERASAHPGRIQFLISDVMMPRMDGPAAARALRERDPALPVLFISGYTAEAALGTGALEGSAFLAKPFTPDELCRKVRDMLDRVPAGA